MLGVAGTGSPRPRVKPEIRERARARRVDGKTVPEISRELGMSRSTAWLIVKDIAWTPAHDVASRQADAANAGGEPTRSGVTSSAKMRSARPPKK